jgi:hypothetical protein
VLQVQQQIAEEYEQVKAITTTLQLFKVDGHQDKPLGRFLKTLFHNFHCKYYIDFFYLILAFT